MKKYITFLLLIAAIGVKAQTIKIKSYLGDSILIVKGSRQMAPVPVTMAGDSARSYNWNVSVFRDSTTQTSIGLTLYDKNGIPVAYRNLNISETAYTRWSSLFTAIDNYIHNQISRIVLH